MKDKFAKYAVKAIKNDDEDKFSKHRASKNEERSFLSKLLPNIAAGVTEGGRNIVNLPHNLVNLFSPDMAQHIPHQEPFDYAAAYGLPKEQRTPADEILQGITQYLPNFVVPGANLGKISSAVKSVPKVGKLLNHMLGNAATQGGLAAVQNMERPLESAGEAAKSTLPFSFLSNFVTSANPYARIGARLGLGGLGGYLGHELSKAFGGGTIASDISSLAGAGLGLIGQNPKLEARRKMLKGVEGTDYKGRLEAAKRLGLAYLTPAEASGNPFVGAAQGSIGKTEKGSKLLYERGEKRLESEENSISHLLDSIYHEGNLGETQRNLYKVSGPTQLSEQDIAPFNDNEVIKRAVKIVESKPAFKESLKNTPKDSIEYWDHIKQALDDMIEKAPDKEARIIKSTRKQVIEKLDSISPEYKEARALAERKIARRNFEKVFNSKEMRGTSLVNFLKNKQNFSSMMHSLRNVPEAQGQLKDMQSIFKDLINPPTVRTAAALARTSMTEGRSGPQVLMEKAKELFTRGKHDEAAIELITNPKWAEELHKINELTRFEDKLSKTFDLLGRASASYNAASSSKEK